MGPVVLQDSLTFYECIIVIDLLTLVGCGGTTTLIKWPAATTWAVMGYGLCRGEALTWLFDYIFDPLRFVCIFFGH